MLIISNYWVFWISRGLAVFRIAYSVIFSGYATRNTQYALSTPWIPKETNYFKRRKHRELKDMIDE
jgi:hypothetical protein